MELYVAGGCSEHGRNCFLVKGGKSSFIVDAGLMKETPGSPYPRLTGEQIRDAQYLFLTHCHADHTGALPFLLKHGFSGRIVASRFTYDMLRFRNPNSVTVEHLGESGRMIPLERGMSMMWGRTGHCQGSVWFLIQFQGKKLLFSGDYTEHSQVYKVDKIRDLTADLAVIDCAYGRFAGGGDYNLDSFRNEIAEMKAEKRPMLFPVPAHGRGFDVMRELMNQDIPVYADQVLIDELVNTKDRGSWLKKRFIRKLREYDLHRLDEFPEPLSFVLYEKYGPNMHKSDRFSPEVLEAGKLIRGAEAGRKPGKGAVGILIRDSQLSKAWNRASALEVYGEGGITILTGKQLPTSYAKTLLDSNLAVFRRLSVHQNADELMNLREKNNFRTIIPYHCGEVLSFDKKNIKVMHPGENIRF